MSKSRGKKGGQAPPQLIGILADALARGATSFRLEPNPPYLMASFAAGSRAMEIDFEPWAGREIMDYIAGQVTDPKLNAGRFVLEYNGRRYTCRFTLDRKRDPQQADVAWE